MTKWQFHRMDCASMGFPFGMKDLISMGYSEYVERYGKTCQVNYTGKFITEIIRFIKEGRVFRISLMGDTRSGKSEMAITLCKYFEFFYNKALAQGSLDKKRLELQDKVKFESIEFTAERIHSDQITYMNDLRMGIKKAYMKFGQIHLIDESKTEIGGIGTMSQEIELQNVNNICAMFCQNEIWITPQKMIDANCPYGIQVLIKDMAHEVNWGFIFKIVRNPTGDVDYVPLGWVGFGLHDDKELRNDYESKKKEWVSSEILGRPTGRMKIRKEVSESLSTDDFFCRKRSNGRYILSTEQQLALLESYIQEGKFSDFNEMEKYRIVREARMIRDNKDIEKLKKQSLHRWSEPSTQDVSKDNSTSKQPSKKED